MRRTARLFVCLLFLALAASACGTLGGLGDLERGDVVQAEGANVSGRYVADEIEAVRNVRGR